MTKIYKNKFLIVRMNIKNNNYKKKKQNREIKKHTQSQYFLKYVKAKLNEYFESKKTSSEMKHKKVKEIYQKNRTNNENMEEADTKICLNKTKKN